MFASFRGPLLKNFSLIGSCFIKNAVGVEFGLMKAKGGVAVANYFKMSYNDRYAIPEQKALFEKAKAVVLNRWSAQTLTREEARPLEC